MSLTLARRVEAAEDKMKECSFKPEINKVAQGHTNSFLKYRFRQSTSTRS